MDRRCFLNGHKFYITKKEFSRTTEKTTIEYVCKWCSCKGSRIAYGPLLHLNIGDEFNGDRF